jgi:hypothetical protein
MLTYRRLVQPDADGRFYHEEIIATAKESGWIGEEYLYFLQKCTAGTAVIETERAIGMIFTLLSNSNYKGAGLLAYIRCNAKSFY